MVMLEVYRFLYEHSVRDSVLRLAQNELYFQFHNCAISIFFNQLKENGYDENFVSVDDVDFNLLIGEQIVKVVVKDGSYLNYDCDGRKEYLDCYKPYTSMAYELVKDISGQFPNCIDGFQVGTYCVDDSCSMCDDVYEYGYQIEINEHFWMCKDFYQYIIEKSTFAIRDFNIPSFYGLKNEIIDNYELKYISTNTKTRRIGYLKILLSMFEGHPQIPITKLSTRFEQLCQNYEQYRLQYKNTKGNVVVTKKGSSAEPYIELAQKLGLLYKGSGIYRLGKMGKVYEVIASHFDLWKGNPFELNRLDIIFWSELILREDYWFMYSILEQAAIKPTISYNTLKKAFKNILIKQIENHFNDLLTNSSSALMRLRIMKRQISQWEKPEVYMEHILMPRLNWLYDLDYIQLYADLSFSLTKKGERLLFNLASWNDIAMHKVCSSTAWLNLYYMKMMNSVFESNLDIWNDLSSTNIMQVYLEKDFDTFRTLAPNRITFSIFASYFKYALFEKENIVIDEDDIRKMFESNMLPLYVLKYQPQYKDGYIQKVK